jgi:hypothetical protein
VPSASDQAVIAYDQGKVFFFNWISYLDEHRAGVVLDASSGKLVGGKVNGELAVPPVCQAFAITGSNIYGIGTGGPYGCDAFFDVKKVMVEMSVVDRSGQVKGRGKANTLIGPDLTSEHEAMVMNTGRPWLFSPWLPFTLSSNRIYVRSNFQLICIGETKGGN